MVNFEKIYKTPNCKISFLSVTSRKILAPDSFICSNGMVLYDRLFYIKKGGMEFVLNTGQKVIFREQSLIYLPYDITYKSRWLENGEFISVNFIFTDESEQLLHFADNITLLLTDKHNEIIRTFEEIWEAQLKVYFEHNLLITSLLYMILYKVAKTTHNNEIKKEYKRIQKAVQYLEANYTLDFELSELADQCNLSIEMFRIYFVKLKGIPPMKYKNMLRLEKAYELLLSKEYSVKEVSNIVGYNDISYFSRMFKKKYGYPPIELLN